MHHLILASTSPYRKQVFEQLGVPFEVRSPGVDESHFKSLPAQVQAITLAEEKARAISVPGALVIGSDQVVDLDGEVLGKPGTEERAVEQLIRLSGRPHRLITAVAVHRCDDGRIRSDVDVHTLWMRPLERDIALNYVRRDLPLDCAGSYKLERRGVALFDKIEADPQTADDTAIIGLPLQKLLALLRTFGVDILKFP